MTKCMDCHKETLGVELSPGCRSAICPDCFAKRGGLIPADAAAKPAKRAKPAPKPATPKA